MKKILYVSLGILITLSTGVLGYEYNNSKLNSVEAKKLAVSAEWGYEYKSVEELYNKSDLVVIAKAKAKEDNKGNTITYEPYDFDNSVVYTLYDAKLKYIFKGNSSLSKNIEVINYGGNNSEGYNVTWEQVEDINNNNMYLLFLEKIPGDSNKDSINGKFRPIGGVQGIYEINSNDKQFIKNLLTKEAVSLKDVSSSKLSLNLKEISMNIHDKVLMQGLDKLINLQQKQ